VNIGALVEKRADQRGRHIGQTSGLGAEANGDVSHLFWQIGDFGRYNEYTGVFCGPAHG